MFKIKTLNKITKLRSEKLSRSEIIDYLIRNKIVSNSYVAQMYINEEWNYVIRGQCYPNKYI